MLSALIGIIIVLVICGVLWWAVQQILGTIPIAEPFATLVRVLLVIVGVLIAIWVLLTLLGAVGIHVPLSFGTGWR